MTSSSWPIMAVALVGLVVVVTMIVVPGHSTDGPSRGHARDILDERYAAGELSTEEYHERRGSLGEPDDSGRGSPPQRLALIIGIASLVVLVLVISLAMGVGNWSMPMFGHMGWGSNEATGGSARRSSSKLVICGSGRPSSTFASESP